MCICWRDTCASSQTIEHILLWQKWPWAARDGTTTGAPYSCVVTGRTDKNLSGEDMTPAIWTMSLYCWGYNYGQLGDGSNTNDVPVLVSVPANHIALNFSSVTSPARS